MGLRNPSPFFPNLPHSIFSLGEWSKLFDVGLLSDHFQGTRVQTNVQTNLHQQITAQITTHPLRLDSTDIAASGVFCPIKPVSKTPRVPTQPLLLPKHASRCGCEVGSRKLVSLNGWPMMEVDNGGSGSQAGQSSPCSCSLR